MSAGVESSVGDGVQPVARLDPLHPLASWIILSYAAVLIADGLFGWRLCGSWLSFRIPVCYAFDKCCRARFSRKRNSGSRWEFVPWP